MNLLQKTLATIGMLAAFVIFIFIFIIMPTITDIKIFNERIQLERVALENKYTSRRNIQNIVADLNEVSEKIVPLEEKITIPPGCEVNFISSLEQLATENSLIQKINLQPIETEDEKSNKIAQKYNLTISLSGNYIDTIKYLRDLETADFYIIIYGMNVSSGAEQKTSAISTGAVKTNIQAYVYFSI